MKETKEERRAVLCVLFLLHPCNFLQYFPIQIKAYYQPLRNWIQLSASLVFRTIKLKR